MEPTIYKPSIYKGAGIYKIGAEGGREKEIIIPAEYKRVQYVEVNGNTPYCNIETNDIQYYFHLPPVNFGDSKSAEFLLNADEATNDKGLQFFYGSANYGTTSIAFRQMLNYQGQGYAVEIVMNGLYNYGGYQKTFVYKGNEYAKGYYRCGMYYDSDLKGFVNSDTRQLGTAPKDFSYYMSPIMLLTTDTAAIKGTKIFSVKVSDKLNFIPCKRISDGVVGFWENINEVFVFPRGFSSGCFDAGPDY